MLVTETKTRVGLKNILLATDFSAVSEAALQYAEAIARRFGSKLYAVHVIEPSEYTYVPGGAGQVPWELDHERAKEELEHLNHRIGRIPHETLLLHGEMGNELREMAHAKGVDLLVMGTHGRRGLERVLLGSKTELVFRQATCPVLTVGPKVMTDPPQEIEFKHILYATDFSPESLAAMPYAASLAQEFQAGLTMINVVKLPLEPMESMEVITADHERRLRKLVGSDVELWCHPETVVKFGDPARTILTVAKEQNADLIVLGVRGAGSALGMATHVAHAIAHEVVTHAPCPVLTVRG